MPGWQEALDWFWRATSTVILVVSVVLWSLIALGYLTLQLIDYIGGHLA